MKVLVTGANGFLGRGVVSALVDLGVDVIATGHTTDKIIENVQKIDADLFALDNPFEKLGQPNVLLHLAYHDGFVLNSEAHAANIGKHMQFLKKMADSGVDKIVVMGTMHEVGFYEGSIDENTVTHPANYYGVAKDAIRNYVQVLAENTSVKWQWLRAFYIVDGTSYGNSIFSKLYAAAQRGDVTFPFTTGKNQYDFLDYAEFSKRVAATVIQDEIQGIINISSGQPESLASRVERFIQENNLNIVLEYGAFPDRPFDSKAVWGNSTKIDKILTNLQSKRIEE